MESVLSMEVLAGKVMAREITRNFKSCPGGARCKTCLGAILIDEVEVEEDHAENSDTDPEESGNGDDSESMGAVTFWSDSGGDEQEDATASEMEDDDHPEGRRVGASVA